MGRVGWMGNGEWGMARVGRKIKRRGWQRGWSLRVGRKDGTKQGGPRYGAVGLAFMDALSWRGGGGNSFQLNEGDAVTIRGINGGMLSTGILPAWLWCAVGLWWLRKSACWR